MFLNKNRNIRNVSRKFKGTQGHVYILTNPSIPDQVKIGYTQLDDVNLRSKQLSKDTGVPTPFVVFASKIFDNCMLAEKMMHSYFSEDTDPVLKKGRVNENREFFWTTPESALEYLNKIHHELHTTEQLNNTEITLELNKGIECFNNQNYYEAINIFEKIHFKGNCVASFWLGECYSILANKNNNEQQKLYYKAADYYSYGVLFQYRPAFQKAYQAYFNIKQPFKSDIIIDKFCSYIQYNRIKLTELEMDMIIHHLKRNLGKNDKLFNMYNKSHPCWKIYNYPLMKRLKKIIKENKKTEESENLKKVQQFLYINKYYFLKFTLVSFLILIFSFVGYIYYYGNDIKINQSFINTIVGDTKGEQPQSMIDNTNREPNKEVSNNNHKNTKSKYKKKTNKSKTKKNNN